MNEQQIKIVRQLRAQGYAVCIFTPEEMPYSAPDRIEDAMCEAGWNTINFDTPEGERISA